MGMLADRGGDDLYIGVQYVQSFAHIYGSGLSMMRRGMTRTKPSQATSNLGIPLISSCKRPGSNASLRRVPPLAGRS